MVRAREGDHQRHHDGRHFEHGHQRRHEAFGRIALQLPEGLRRDKRHGRDRAVVRRDGRRVDPVHAADLAQHHVRRDRRQHAQRQRHQRRPDHHGPGCVAQLGPALEPDSQQQVDRKRLVKRLGKRKIAANQLGDDAKGKGQNDGREQVRQQDLQHRTGPAGSQKLPAAQRPTLSSCFIPKGLRPVEFSVPLPETPSRAARPAAKRPECPAWPDPAIAGLEKPARR